MATDRTPLANRYTIINRSTGEVIPHRERFVLIDRTTWEIVAWYGTYEHALAGRTERLNRNILIGLVVTEDRE